MNFKSPSLSIFLAIFAISCSEVEFRTAPDELAKSELGGPFLRINNGDQFTRFSAVQLELGARNATQMYVTHDSTCESGGVWQGYDRHRPWQLNNENGEAHVYVKYRNKFDQESDCVTDEIVHDNIPPNLAWQSVPAKLNNHRLDDFTYEANDWLSGIDRVLCSAQGGQLSSCAKSQALVQNNEGLQSIKVWAFDRAGNASSELIYHWEVDLTPPSLNFTKGPGAYSNKKAVDFAVVSADKNGLKQILWSEDGHNYQPGNLTKDLKVLAEGSKSVFVKAVDNLGNTSLPLNYKWVADFTPPVVEITEAPAAMTASSAAQFKFTIKDEHSPVSATCASESQSPSSCATHYQLQNIVDGHHQFSLQAQDAAGNKARQLEHKWLSDTVAPQILFTQQPQDMTNLTTGTVAYKITDSGSGLSTWNCHFDNKEQDCPQTLGSESFSKLPLGWHDFVIFAKDKVGHQSEQRLSFKVVQAVKDMNQALDLKTDGAVDILFVMDNSTSMYREQKEMADRFDSFLGVLDGLSWQVAVTTTDMDEDEDYGDGRLISFAGKKGPFHLDHNMNPQKADNLFSKTIRRKESGSYKEQGIKANYRALERRAKDENHKNFFRQNSHLQTILVSDENETGRKSKNKAENLLKLVKNTFGPKKKFKFHSIIVRPKDWDCSETQGHSTGYEYVKISELTKGVIGDVCAENYTEQFKDIGEDIRLQVARYDLECEPWQGQFSIQWAHGAQPIDYKVDGSVLVFSQSPPKGRHILRYQCPLF